jgi:hypothetical protein
LPSAGTDRAPSFAAPHLILASDTVAVPTAPSVEAGGVEAAGREAGHGDEAEPTVATRAGKSKSSRQRAERRLRAQASPSDSDRAARSAADREAGERDSRRSAGAARRNERSGDRSPALGTNNAPIFD